MTSQDKIGIFELLELSILENSKKKGTQITPKPKEPISDEQKKQKKGMKRWVFVADLTGAVTWAYWFIKFFVADVDVLLIRAINPGLQWILGFKSIGFLFALFVVGIFVWKIKTVLFVVYVLFFPLIVLFWKVPKVVFKSKSWIFALAAINTLGLAFKNYRYNLITKSISIIFIILVLYTDVKPVLMVAAAGLLAVIVIATFRITKNAFSPDWFIQVHEKIIRRLTSTNQKEEEDELSRDIEAGKVTTLDENQVQALINKINSSLFVNRGLYFWAYQLRRYRQSGLSIAFNIMSVLWLLAGFIVCFWVINLAIYKIDPSQFHFDYSSSRLAIFLYSFTMLFLGDAAGITPVGDLAIVTRIIAGALGAVFVTLVIINVFLTFKHAKDEEGLNDLVATLKKRAKSTEDNFRKRYSLSIDEAAQKMQDMNKGLHAFFDLFMNLVPAEFINEDEPKSKN